VIATGGLAVQQPSPTTFVIDTSVAIKWYLPEIYQAEAHRFLATGHDRHAPDFVHAEIGSALLKKVRRRETSDDECRRYMVKLAVLPLFAHESLPLRPAALEIALQVGSSFYYGLFLALALQLRGRLVTADDKFCRKVKGTILDHWVLWVADPI
jgi:predicted nucleic acid-binding protein